MKDNLRKTAIEKRKTLNCKELSKQIVNNILSLKEYQAAKNIICYYPLKFEVDVSCCLKNNKKNWYLPRVNGQLLDICPAGDLTKGSFGIMEPVNKKITDYSRIDMIIIPACAGDRNGYRLGYGKGYYDRFLPCLPKECIKILPVFSELLYENIFPEKHDVKADIIVTDKEILRMSRKASDRTELMTLRQAAAPD